MDSFSNDSFPAIIYCRVSSDKQVREGHGLEGQEKRCRDFAGRNNFNVERIFREEGISGGVISRPAMKDLLQYLEKHPGKTIVIIDDLKRLARNIEGHFELKTQIEIRGGIIKSPSHKFDSSPLGKLLESLYASVAEFERNENKVQVRNRMQSRLELGYWVFNNPVGYKFTNDPMHGKLLDVDEPNAFLIQEAFSKFSSDELLTQRDVQKFLLERGLKNSRGKKMNVWLEGVKRIFTNPIYAGFIEYPKWKVNIRKGKHPSIVSPEIFELVNQKLSSKRKYFKSGLEKDFPLRGLLICAVCGRKLTASFSKGRNSKFPYYRCPSTKECNVKPKSVQRDFVESEFLKLLDKKKLKPEVLQLAKRIMEELFKSKQYDYQMDIDIKRKKINRIQTEIDKNIKKILDCSSSVVIEGIEKEVERLNKEKVTLESVIQSGSEFPVNLNDSIDAVMTFLANPSSYWKHGGLHQKRVVQSLLFTGAIEYSKEKGFGTANFSLPFKLLQEASGTNSNLVEAAGIASLH